MKTTAPFFPLLFTSALLFLSGFYLESWVGRFMRFWMPKVSWRPRAFVKFLKVLFFSVGVILICAALLGRMGLI